MDLVEKRKEAMSNRESFQMKFSQNYRNGNGKFGTVFLSEEELGKVRQAHGKHCLDVLAECEADFGGDPGKVLAVFEKRADKVFSWIQQALEEKVRMSRGGEGYGSGYR
ncbi:MAG: hypothetical protein K9K34_06060 [Desulfarculaceae bacterium]|nr:hypothetical protein [Desulfarculaceae bacterium]